MIAVRIQQTDFVKNPYYNITLEQRVYVLDSTGTKKETSVSNYRIGDDKTNN